MAFIRVQGIATNVQQVGSRISYKRNGLAERVTTYKSQGFPGYIPIPLITAFPDQTAGGFVCDETRVEGPNAGGFYLVTVTWVAISTPGFSYVTYDSKMVQIPIDQSPDFINIAGSPDSPQNGALFDANGQFIGFLPGSPYFGVVSVYMAQNLMIVHGTGTQPPIPRTDLFCESINSTIRGAVWEWEVTYNLNIDVNTGIPFSSN